MAKTYEPIATTTLSGTQLTISFTSISSAYTDLRVVVSAVGTLGQVPIMRFNSDTATNYSWVYLQGNGTAGASAAGATQSSIYLDRGAAPGLNTVIPSVYIIDIFSYTGSINKTALVATNENQNGSGVVQRIVGMWRSSAAISTISFTIGSTNTFNSGTTATLYGIKAA